MNEITGDNIIPENPKTGIFRRYVKNLRSMYQNRFPYIEKVTI